MKFACTVIGHERIQREGKDGSHEVRIKMRGQATKLRIDLIVPESDRDQYPYGSSATLDFEIQQEMKLVKGAKAERVPAVAEA